MLLEDLIRNSFLLSEEKKKETLERVKNGNADYKVKLEKILSQEDELIFLLFKKYAQETGEDPIALLKWGMSSFTMKNIRDEEQKERDWEILTLDF